MSEHGGGWANPAPAGLVALAMACLPSLLFYREGGDAIPLLGIWLLGGFAVQVIVGIIELKEGNTTGGNVFTFFSAFFMLVTGLEMIFKYLAIQFGWTIDPTIDGWAWLPLAIALLLWTPAYFKGALSMLLAVVALDVAVPIIAFKDMGLLGAAWGPVAGWALLIAGIFGLYTASAIVLNTAYGRPVLPTGGPLVK